MKKSALTVLLTLFFALMLSFSPRLAASSFKDSIVRLHILANSDSDEDQLLKLSVRDAIIENTDFVTEGIAKSDIDEDVLKEIEETAADVIKEQGYDYTVKAVLTNEYFDTRDYGYFALPCGDYDAVRVEIGKAEGKNWWCVLFPPLCTPIAEADVKTAALKAGFSETDIGIITKGDAVYSVRFKTMEIVSELKHKLFDK